MHCKLKKYRLLASMMAVALLTGCGSQEGTSATTRETETEIGTESTEQVAEETTEETGTGTEAVTGLPQMDMSKWQYNATDHVYYQIGIQYCEVPVNLTYETLSVFVPESYMTAKDNGDSTYTCTINTEADVNGYSALNAPVVIPVNTPGYSACEALTEYTDVSDYTDAGFVYIHAGCRGKDQGAPAGVTDLKAAIRYIRYNSGVIAGDMNRIFSFGMSGGGAQSALLGSTGDSQMYDVYLKEIGAVQGVSDGVAGAMCWCPITGLDSADEAYEWNMGSSRSNLTEEEQEISDSMASAFASYINDLGITDENGNRLTLEESQEGIYQSGTYYAYIKNVIETSLNNFLAETTFPYNADTAAGSGNGGPGGGMAGAKGPGGMTGESGPTGGAVAIENIDNIARTGDTNESAITISGTYDTAQDYIDALNKNVEWVTYDAQTNTATITDIANFSLAVKSVSKDLAAFDQLDAGQGENTLFGYGDGTGAHFDGILADILEGTEYSADFAEDLAKEDAMGNTVDYRLKMYSPLYFLMESNEGYETATIAKYWRIRSGAWQGDTALTSEVNLALALENYTGVEVVDFATIWGQKHVEAESTGNSTSNFIEWVNECIATE